MKKDTNILFVCTQNLDRSPTAELIAQKEAEKYPQYNINIDSAGLRTTKNRTFEGRTDYMLIALRRLGYNPTNHIPKKVTQELLQQQDTIFCFSNTQYEILNQNYFNLKNKLYQLPKYTQINKEILAPHKKILKIPNNLITNKLLSITEYVSYRDKEGIINIHSKMIRDLEKQIQIAFEEMFK